MNKSHKIEWGNKHIKYIKDYQKAYNFAYQKAFYCDVFLNSTKFVRAF